MQNLATRNANFRQLLAALNPRQRRAVEQIEGPALVIAGPGTGKTHLLAARIGHILLETDTAAQNILCLTFTEAGAQAMRQRLLEIIGAEGYRVAVFTFHGFCSRVISDNPEYFGWRDFEPASDLERIEIIRNLLEKLPENHALRRERKNPFVFENQLRDLFSLMKKENWTPSHVQKTVRDYLEDLPKREKFIYKKSGKGFKKGDLKILAIAEENEKMARLAAAADLFPKFNHAMHAAGRYDFDDMILWTLDAFQKNEKLRLNYQERFLYLLVDEFQDTNGAQNRLLELLTDFWEQPNIFIVGDDDQSIYEFQGARLKNLRDFYEKYHPGLALTVLTENYRSAQNILDAAGRLIQKNELRAVRLFDPPLEKTLSANVIFDSKPIVVTYPSSLAEVADVVAQIADLQSLGVDLSKIAVLYREHRQADIFLKLLEKRGIPFETKRPENVLDLPLVRQFRALLEYLRDEQRRSFSGGHRLFEILHFRFWKVQPLDVARLAARGHVYETSKSFVNVWVENEPENLIFRWREAISNQDFLKKANLAEPQPILEISQKMEDWLLAMHEMPLPFFLEKILNQSGLLGWAMSLPDRIFHFSAINTLLEFVKKESLRHPRGYSLDRFLDQLDTLDANRLPISMQRHIRMTNHQITKSPNHPVNLLTAHGSKGMEFSHVFLIGCNEENWENKKNTRSGRFSLPDNLTFSEVEDETESLRRLFYVATTRAKTHLQISFSRKNLEGKTQLPSQFLGETGLEILEKMPDTATLFEAQSLLLLDPPRPTVTLPEGAVLDDLLEKFVLSPTSFNRYLRCPLAFYYQDVLCVPDFSSENAAFGQAMHRALQLYFLQMKKTPGREFPPENILTADFEKEMDTRRAFFGSENFRQMMALGKSILPKYRAEKMSGWRKNSEVERRIGLVEMSGVPLTGVIDRFEKLENSQIRVVDYKTGGFRKEKTEPPSEKLPHGGDYRRQLFFYKILLEAFVPSPGQVISGVISYLEPENSGHFRDVEIEFSPSELDFVKKLIIETDAKIRRREFSEGCGEADCSWCRLHRENEFPEKLENREEGLDDF